jgi:putative membrane protein
VTVHDLPAINATLNGTSSVLLLAAYVCIKAKKVRAHAWLILSALLASSLFLTGYLIYHAHVGATYVDVRFPNVPAALRLTYKLILFPHLTLAMVMLPFIGRSLYLAYHRQWVKHRRISPWSFWIWLYVSVTGVIIYWMLYHLFPGMQGAAVAGASL